MSEEKDPKFDPVKEFVTLRDSITRAVGQGIRNVTTTSSVFPAVDVYETEDTVVVRTEPLHGANAADFEVAMEEDVLVLTGKTVDDLEVDEAAFLHRELRFGPFAREVHIPRKVDAQKAQAAFKNGVLTITLPKLKAGASQIIDITPAE